jgi:hypothetical protein
MDTGQPAGVTTCLLHTNHISSTQDLSFSGILEIVSSETDRNEERGVRVQTDSRDELLKTLFVIR